MSNTPKPIRKTDASSLLRESRVDRLEAIVQEHGSSLADLHAVVREMVDASKANNDRVFAQLGKLTESVQSGLAATSARIADVELKSRTTNWPSIFAGGTFIIAIVIAFISSKVEPVSSSFSTFKETFTKSAEHENTLQDRRVDQTSEMSLRAYELAIRADERTKNRRVD